RRRSGPITRPRAASLRLTWPGSETGRHVAAKTWPTDADVSPILKGSVGPLLRDDAATLQAISTAFLSALAPQSAAADRLWDYQHQRARAGDSALPDPRHILAAADADGAAFDPDGARVDLEEMSRVAIAVVDVVEPSRPVAGPVRH